jgi:hypothetical protein
LQWKHVKIEFDGKCDENEESKAIIVYKRELGIIGSNDME